MGSQGCNSVLEIPSPLDWFFPCQQDAGFVVLGLFLFVCFFPSVQSKSIKLHVVVAGRFHRFKPRSNSSALYKPFSWVGGCQCWPLMLQDRPTRLKSLPGGPEVAFHIHLEIFWAVFCSWVMVFRSRLGIFTWDGREWSWGCVCVCVDVHSRRLDPINPLQTWLCCAPALFVFSASQGLQASLAYSLGLGILQSEF